MTFKYLTLPQACSDFNESKPTFVCAEVKHHKFVTARAIKCRSVINRQGCLWRLIPDTLVVIPRLFLPFRTAWWILDDRELCCLGKSSWIHSDEFFKSGKFANLRTLAPISHTWLCHTLHGITALEFRPSNNKREGESEKEEKPFL